jgi:hypothetical protein
LNLTTRFGVSYFFPLLAYWPGLAAVGMLLLLLFGSFSFGELFGELLGSLGEGSVGYSIKISISLGGGCFYYENSVLDWELIGGAYFNALARALKY